MTIELKLEGGHKVHVSTCFIQEAESAKRRDMTVSALLRHLHRSSHEVTGMVYLYGLCVDSTDNRIGMTWVTS